MAAKTGAAIEPLVLEYGGKTLRAHRLGHEIVVSLRVGAFPFEVRVPMLLARRLHEWLGRAAL